MQLLIVFLVGFLSAFIGLIAPSMLNMTAARTSIEYGRKAGIQFSAGAATVVFVQAFIALHFAKYLVAHPEVIEQLKIAAVVVLFLLAIFFFIQARKQFKAEGKEKKGNKYVIGLGMSSLNMMAIPFYLTMATLAEQKGWMVIEQPYVFIFVIAAVLGAFSLFSIYAIYAEKIATKAQFISKNINYILSGLFVILSISILFSII